MVSPNSFVEHEFDGGIKRNNLNLFMQGDDVFAFVISNVPRATRALIEHFNVDLEKNIIVMNGPEMKVKEGNTITLLGL